MNNGNMTIRCMLFGHVAEEYGSQGKISEPYYDGIGRAHRSVKAQCARCGTYFSVGSVIDAAIDRSKENSNG